MSSLALGFMWDGRSEEMLPRDRTSDFCFRFFKWPCGNAFPFQLHLLLCFILLILSVFRLSQFWSKTLHWGQTNQPVYLDHLPLPPTPQGWVQMLCSLLSGTTLCIMGIIWNPACRMWELSFLSMVKVRKYWNCLMLFLCSNFHFQAFTRR